MRIDEALFELGNIIGHDAMIQDNANEPISVEDATNETIRAVNSPPDDIPEEDYAISENGIYKIRSDGIIEQVPIYRVVPNQAPKKKYELVYYLRDDEKCKIEFETDDLHDDEWNALYAVVSAANPDDRMSKSNHDFVNDLSDLTWDEYGFTACSGDIMITAKRVS